MDADGEEAILTRVLAYVQNHHLGLIAIFIALTGTAYAAQKAPKNSVVSKSIAKGAVTNPKLAPNSVDGSKIADGSLTGADINAASLGVVPNAGHATSADTATSAAKATQADNSDRLGGAAASSYLKGADVPGGQLAGTYAAPALSGSGGGTAGAQAVPQEGCSAGSAVSGPSVTVTVPASGFVELLARTTFQAASGNTLSACLIRDGAYIDTILISAAGATETLYTLQGDLEGTSNLGLASWLPMFTAPGVHTFKLAYGRGGATAGTNQVSNRVLLVRALS